MRRFIARANIKHLRARLESEVEPKARAFVTKLLVEEEDKLGADLKLLEELDQHVRSGHERIARQAGLVDTMERDGHDGLSQARALLDGLVESQCLHEGYRQRVLIRIEENEA